MRKLKLQVQLSVDGFVSGPNGEMNWMKFPWSDDLNQYVTKITGTVDTILLGRKLAEGFIPHWETVANDPQHPEHATGIMFTKTPKFVFSQTLAQPTWQNTKILAGAVVKEVSTLKWQEGKDMIVYGGGRFVSELIAHNLIDEYYLFVNPAILGQGLPIFQAVISMQKLELIESVAFDCGILLVVYKPA